MFWLRSAYKKRQKAIEKQLDDALAAVDSTRESFEEIRKKLKDIRDEVSKAEAMPSVPPRARELALADVLIPIDPFLEETVLHTPLPDTLREVARRQNKRTP